MFSICSASKKYHKDRITVTQQLQENTQIDDKTICIEFLHSSVREVISAPNRARLPKNQNKVKNTQFTNSSLYGHTHRRLKNKSDYWFRHDNILTAIFSKWKHLHGNKRNTIWRFFLRSKPTSNLFFSVVFVSIIVHNYCLKVQTGTANQS